MRSLLFSVLALFGVLALGAYLLFGVSGDPRVFVSDAPTAAATAGQAQTEDIVAGAGGSQSARVPASVEVPVVPQVEAQGRSAGVSLRVTTDWGRTVGSASTLILQGERVEARVAEVRQKQALFEDLPPGAWITLRWMSGRERSFRGLLHEELIQLPIEGQRNLHLVASQSNGDVGHVRMSVLTPPELDGTTLNFSIRQDGERSYFTSLRSAPWEVPAFGEARVDLWRLAPGRWTVHSEGLGEVGEFAIDAERWSDVLIDLRELAVVRVHVLQAVTGQPVQEARVSWSHGTSGSWGTARDLGAEFGHVREAWIFPGASQLRASASGADSGVVDFEVLPGSNELILDLETKVEIEHNIVLAHNGEFQALDLEAWVDGHFQTLEGDGEVESIKFEILEGLEKPMASAARIVVSAEGRYRWFLPEALDAGLSMIEFSVDAREVHTTTVEIGAWNGWVARKDG